MPICENKIKEEPIPIISEGDYNASEAAKIKRIREQAYFNSYDFDAIEVLPSTSSEDDDDNNNIKFQHSNNNHQHLSGKNRVVTSIDNNNIILNNNNSIENNKNIITKSSNNNYFKRFTSLFITSPTLVVKKSINNNIENDNDYIENNRDFHISDDIENQQINLQNINNNNNSNHYSDNSNNNLIDSDIKLYDNISNNNNNKIEPNRKSTSTTLHNKQNSGFLLPRAMLKYQSNGLMPMLSSSSSSTSSSSSSAIIINGSTNKYSIEKDQSQSQTFNNNNIITIAADVIQSNGSSKSNSISSISNSSSSLTATDNNTVIQSSCSRRSSNCSCLTNCSCNNENQLLPQHKNLHSNTRNHKDTSSFSSSIATSNSRSSIRGCVSSGKVTPQTTTTTIAIINTPILSSDPVSNQDQCNSISRNKINDDLVETCCYNEKATISSSVVSDRERGNILISSSNYSTEKSGSSGYYSSNLCSTSSVEEHIYSEPVIDIIVDTSSRIPPLLSTSSSSSKLYKLRQGLINLQNDNNNKNLKIDLIKNQHQQQHQNHSTNKQNNDLLKMNENLRILETSIKNLDSHLKNYHYPKLNNIFDNQHHHQQNQLNFKPITTTTAATAFVQYNNAIHQSSSIPDEFYHTNNQNVIGNITATKHYQLPTIMEGIDNQSTKKIKSWTAATNDDIIDDSLMDIDLDSFLLVNEKLSKNNVTTKLGIKNSHLIVGGIDNPSFDKSLIFNEEALESNYKCTKYVNSCPEDAYKLESDLGTNNNNNNNSNNNQIISTKQVIENSQPIQSNNSIAFFLKKYEDQIHFQNTREMLEDIHDKIRNINVIAGGVANVDNDENHNNEENNNNNVIPKELESNISVLKLELETYLRMMNRNSDMEIKQFCNGLVNNQKLVTMTNAFERRKSLTNNSFIDPIGSNIEYEYEPIRNITNYYSINNNNNNSAINNNDINLLERNRIINNGTINSRNNSLIRSSDPNFQLKRKSLTDIFPLPSDYHDNNNYELTNFENDEILALANKHNNNNFNIVTSQLQRNLSFHRPILQKHDVQQQQQQNQNNNIINKKDDKDLILIEQHKNKPSSWELYYGTNRINQTLTGKRGQLSKTGKSLMSYPSSRPESDFTLDLPRAEQLRLKMDKEKKFRHRCRILTTFLSLVFFLLTVMVVSLVLTRGKRMFGSML